MKKSIKFFLTMLIGAGLYSCSDDDGVLKDTDPDTQSETYIVNKWIFDKMKANYLWLDEISDMSNYNMKADPETFFYNLISQNETKERNGYTYCYSYIVDNNETKTEVIGEDGYGFDFMLYRADNSTYWARVLYVLPNTPASRAGLKRGMWILKANNTNLTSDTYSMLFSGVALNLTVREVYEERNEYVESVLKMEASELVEDTPILVDSVYVYDDKKVGYLFYNHFTPGPVDYMDQTYNNQLTEIFQKFDSQGITDLIVDLRYNPGGYLTCVQHLASLIADESLDNDVICRITYNPATKYKSDDYRLTKKNGVKLKLNNLGFIMTSQTASASEALYNGFKAFDNVNIFSIGETTEGKNLCSNIFENTQYNWEIHPIIGYVANKKDEGNYGNGLTPDVIYDELDDLENLAELGSVDDQLLKRSLKIIGISFDDNTKMASRSFVNTNVVKTERVRGKRKKYETIIVE